jgi:predicted alpha/beta-hydrolase family hydrolase
MVAAVLEVPTPQGPARVHRYDPPPGVATIGTLALGHGAGGGIGAADLVAVAAAVPGAGWRVLLVEQPWKVAGRKIATPPPRLDLAWLGIFGAGPGAVDPGLVAGPLVQGGRSAGARVACRTAAAVGATAVCCLSFPLHPPGRPERSRVAELAGAGVPALVVQGGRDPFGNGEEIRAALDRERPAGESGPGDVRIVEVVGDHSLSRSSTVVATAVLAWLGELAAAATAGPGQE